MPETIKPVDTKGAAVEAAQSVGDAVRRVADAAIAEIQKRPATGPSGDFSFTATGGKFTIRGNGFGTNGTVKLGGRQLDSRYWGGQYIEGVMPADAQAGDVTVQIDDKTIQHGHYVRS